MPSNGGPTPTELLAKARAGESGSLGTLLDIYRNYLHLLARTQIDLHLRGQANPSDLVQEAFLQACRHFQQFRGNSENELLGWLRQILINHLGQLVEKHVHTQKRDVRREVSLDKRLKALERSSANFEAALVSPYSSPSAQAEQRELAAAVADRLAELPGQYRDVIVLRNLEGLKFEEIARRMGRSAGAVRMLWLRALDLLRRGQESEE